MDVISLNINPKAFKGTEVGMQIHYISAQNLIPYIILFANYVTNLEYTQ